MSGRREQTKANNRAAIVAAGRKVFSTIGYDAATSRDIVRESGLSPGTFYNYFGDKSSIFTHLVSELFARIRPRLVEARQRARSGEAFIADAFRAAVDTLFEDRQLLDVMANSANALRAHIYGDVQLGGLFEELKRDLQSAIDGGLLPPFAVGMMSAAMIGATVELCVYVARSPEPTVRDPEATADFLSALFIGGVGFMGTRKADASSKPSESSTP